MKWFIANELASLELSFADYMQIQGQSYRQVKNRQTLKIILNQRSYYIKKHWGTSLKELLKNWLKGRLAITSAENEYLAINKARSLGIKAPEVKAFGEKGLCPLHQESFIVLEDMQDWISLEELFQQNSWGNMSIAWRRKLIKTLAFISRKLHQNGMNHRDYYICHFLISPRYRELAKKDLAQWKASICLIDWHRCGLRSNTPWRWILKDLAGLYFSALDLGLTQRDLYQFILHYQPGWLKQKKYLAQIEHKAFALYRKVHNKEPYHD